MPNIHEYYQGAYLVRDRQLPEIYRSNEHINTSIMLFRFILAKDDARWKLVEEYVYAKDRSNFKGVHFETACRSIYLSDFDSYRNQYTSYSKAENMRQLSRAINNLSVYPDLVSAFSRSRLYNENGAISILLKRTNNFLMGIDMDGATGCPEALYQLRAFMGDRYVGRVGFNVHDEVGVSCFSITNLQGVPGNPDFYKKIKDNYGSGMFNMLLRKLRELSVNYSSQVELRGLKNPKAEGASGLYNSVLAKEGIKRFSFKRK